MKPIKLIAAILLIFLLLAQTVFAADRYAEIEPGGTVELANSDGTNTYFVLDPSAPAKKPISIDTQWWRQVYDYVHEEIKDRYHSYYAKRGADLIVLLYAQPMDRNKIPHAEIKTADGRTVPASKLTKEDALACATQLFLPPDDPRRPTAVGWYYKGSDDEYDLIALNYMDNGKTTVHELAHAFTDGDPDVEREMREIIAENIVLVLREDRKFLAIESAGSLTA
jgi:hypothetical protein